MSYDYPYCPHGQYVGGCGADYMCGACEGGEQPPTLTELHRDRRSLVAEIDKLNAIVEDAPEIAPDRKQVIADLLTRDLRRKLANTASSIAEVRAWSVGHGPNYRGWLMDRYDAICAEYRTEQAEDDFSPYAGLPDAVLDGSY